MMANLSSIEYEEQRNKDKSLFSRMLKITVTLEPGEGKFEPSFLIPKLIGLTVDHVILFVQDELSKDPCPEFVGGDKVPPGMIKNPQDTGYSYAPAAPKHPCTGCKTEDRCPAPCEKWGIYVQAGGDGMPPKLAPRGDLDAPKPNVVICSVCGAECVKVESRANPGTFYNRCEGKCKENRTKEGKPFPPKGA